MLKAPRKMGLVFFPAFDWAISPTHPEREERLLYTQDQVFEEGILDIEGILEYKPGQADVADIQRTHFCTPDEHTVMTESHFISAGGCITIADAVMNKEVDCGFALIRPPGHHSMRVVHGCRGFCNINNEAIMVEYLRSKYNVDRVAIVDTDTHHGDGSQDIYWHDPDTLFISMHQDGRTLYPGSGFTNEFGGPTACGKTINIPLPPETSEEGFLYTIDEMVMPILKEFKPDLIINSAGQDNHYSDPLANMKFSAQGYAELNKRLKPDIAVLEGGYSIESALPYVNAGIILAMAGMDFSHVKEPDYNPDRIRQTSKTTDYIKTLRDQVMQVWEMGPRRISENRNSMTTDTRSRNIFYDTDSLLEVQEETINICDSCSGAFKIDSYTDRGGKILCIHIPRKACSECSNIAYEWFDRAHRKYDRVFLQNRRSDVYLTK
jgi:acetoin utilization deacetylase AcuC-like enzyme